MVNTFNQSAARFSPQLLPDLFEAQVERTPHAKAVTFGSRELAYGELDAAANRMARYLISRSIGTEDIVALLLPRGVELVVSMIDIVKAGAAYLPLDPDHPSARLLFMLRDSGAALLVTTSEISRALVLPSSLPCLLLDDEQAHRDIANLPANRVTQAERLRPLRISSLLYVIYTSGSTGEPKGVAVEHSSFSVQMRKMARRNPMRPDETILGITTITFDPAAFEIFSPFARRQLDSPGPSREPRSRLYRFGRICPRGLRSSGDAYLLASLAAKWNTANRQGDGRWRSAFVGSCTATAGVSRGHQPLWPYGNNHDFSFHRIVPEDAQRNAIVTIGRPLDDEQFYILDSDLLSSFLPVPRANSS